MEVICLHGPSDPDQLICWQARDRIPDQKDPEMSELTLAARPATS